MTIIASNFSQEVQAFASQIQEIENALWLLYDNRNVNNIPNPSNASPNVLDDFGANVGQPRYGMTDTQYQAAILAKIQANKSCGEPERLIAALRSLTLSISNIHYYEFYPASIHITFEGGIVNGLIGTQMQNIAPGGVQLTLNEIVTGSGFYFDTTGHGFDTGLLGTLITA